MLKPYKQLPVAQDRSAVRALAEKSQNFGGTSEERNPSRATTICVRLRCQMSQVQKANTDLSYFFQMHCDDSN